MKTRIRYLGILAAALLASSSARANHPVLVEGNCDAPVPGTTILAVIGTCGDYDGDGRIGTAEDTDGADRIFGTIAAALGPGTGAAAGTGANNNGLVTIVRSGRFAEQVIITGTNAPTNPPTTILGDVTLEAAPGVEAIIDAVLDADPGGGNATRSGQAGIVIVSPAGRRVTLRNLTVRNWFAGFDIGTTSQVSLINVRVYNHAHVGIRVRATAEVVIDKSEVIGTGFRTGVGTDHPASPPVPGAGIVFRDSANGAVYRTNVTGNFGGGILDQSTGTVTQLDNYLFNN